MTRTLWAIRALLLAAAGIAAYLAWTSLAGVVVAGCGGESGCDAALHGRWAYWLGIPVSTLALGVYAGMFAATWWPKSPTAWKWLALGAMGLLMAAAWFLVVQGFVIRTFCPYCLSAHAFGGAAAVLILRRAPFSRALAFAALGGVGVLIAGQLLYEPRAAELRMPASHAATPAPSAHQLPVYGGKFSLNLDEVPLAGEPRAARVIVCLFDYSCHFCRELHLRLMGLGAEVGDRLAIVSLPTPLDPVCNPAVKKLELAHVDACEYARIGLAVWRAKREAFEPYNRWFFESAQPPSLETARARAAKLVGAEAFENALRDPWIREQIRIAAGIYGVAAKAGHGILPQVISGEDVYVGVLSDGQLRQAAGQPSTR
jgi:uncharacterized membrane protein